MLRRPATVITLTMDDVAAYEDRKAQAAANVEQASRAQTLDLADESNQVQAENRRQRITAQNQALMTPEAQLRGSNDQNTPINETEMLDAELDDSMLQAHSHPQGSLFTPPNAPINEPPPQIRLRTRAERIGGGR